MRWTERLFDPYAPGAGPPPRTLGAFIGWLFAGAWPAVVLLAALSVVVGFSEAVAAWLIGWIVDEAAAGPAAFFAANGALLALAVGFFLVARPGLMILSSALTTRSLGPQLWVVRRTLKARRRSSSRRCRTTSRRHRKGQVGRSRDGPFSILRH